MQKELIIASKSNLNLVLGRELELKLTFIALSEPNVLKLSAVKINMIKTKEWNDTFNSFSPVKPKQILMQTV